MSFRKAVSEAALIFTLMSPENCRQFMRLKGQARNHTKSASAATLDRPNKSAF